MAMTRRKFIKKLIKTAGMLASGTWWAAGKLVPEKFIEAVPMKKYPGSLDSPAKTEKIGKWNG